jgi:hypothetical protein
VSVSAAKQDVLSDAVGGNFVLLVTRIIEMLCGCAQTVASSTPNEMLCVRGISPYATEESVTAVFRQYAPVKSVLIPKDANATVNRGFAFVEFFSVDHAAYALQAVETSKVQMDKSGSVLRVVFAKQSFVQAQLALVSVKCAGKIFFLSKFCSLSGYFVCPNLVEPASTAAIGVTSNSEVIGCCGTPSRPVAVCAQCWWSSACTTWGSSSSWTSWSSSWSSWSSRATATNDDIHASFKAEACLPAQF